MESKLKTKIVLPVIALAVVGVVGSVYTLTHSGSQTASAQTPSTTVSQQAQGDKETADDTNKQGEPNEQNPSYKSSVQIADTNELDEKTEQSKLAGLAKVTSDQAKAAAEKSLGGTASEVKLENEGGNVVYAVTVGTKEAKVDAGNGQILHTETSDGETNDRGSANE